MMHILPLKCTEINTKWTAVFVPEQAFSIFHTHTHTPYALVSELLTLQSLFPLVPSMASSVTRSTSGFSFSNHWLIIAAIALICAFLGYIVYDAIMATASELFQRLLVISPLLLIIIVHWLSTGNQLSFPMPGSEPSAIHRAGGSPWGVAFVLLLLFFFISYQPSLHDLIS